MHVKEDAYNCQEGKAIGNFKDTQRNQRSKRKKDSATTHQQRLVPVRQIEDLLTQKILVHEE